MGRERDELRHPLCQTHLALNPTMTNPTDPGSPCDNDLSANYGRDGAFGAALGVGMRQALLMIDFARAYFDPECPLYPNTPAVVPAAAGLLAWARARQMLICHTQVVYDAQGLNGGVFYRKIPALSAFCEGNPMGDFVEALRPRTGEPVVTKQYASAFSVPRWEACCSHGASTA